MKPLFRAASLAIAFATQGPALAEEPHYPVKPLLWKIEGKDLAKPSYLFGTLHVGVRAVSTFHPATTRAFDSADIVYTETPMDAASQSAASNAIIRNDNKNLSDSIGADLSVQLNAELNQIKYPMSVESLKTWAVATELPLLRFQMTEEKPLDVIIWDRATAASKQTEALEKPEDQRRIYDDLREDEQTALLSETLRQLQEGRKAGNDPTDALITAYLSGNSVRLEAELARQMDGAQKGPHKDLFEKLNKRLLLDRNVSMSNTVATILTEKGAQSHFFAVGSSHLLGKSSLVDLISAQGYRVTRVTK